MGTNDAFNCRNPGESISVVVAEACDQAHD
jgi:hypothetical protein